MLAPYSWIKDYVKTDADVATVTEKVVMTGNAVEKIHQLGENIKNVVVGRIEKIEKHPDADKLQICMLNVGQEELVQIVTGADNVFEGAYVPVALVGAELPTGTKIKKGKLRGVPSNGMLCSGEELELKEEDYPGAGVYGILILKEEAPLGMDIRELLNLNDTVFEFEVGANRPDCLSILGVAREVAAAIEAEIEIPVPSFTENSESIDDYVHVTVEDADLCPRYMARAIKNVKIGPSPAWMQARLKAAGVRPISNIVDITNFVMLETGQPMHAFDAKDIHGSHIIVRRAKQDETMTTLDGKERTFTNNMLLITDESGPIGIAGIMGGENSEIKDDTKTVIFESAKFMYGNIRQSARALGMATEASMRFSKGVDAVTTEYAINRACQLVEMLGAGEIVGGAIDVLAEDLTPKKITVIPAKINELLGTELSAETMISLLNRVYIDTQYDGEQIVCTIPPFRGDMAGSADVAEEVLRIYGYDNIAPEPLKGSVVKGDLSFVEEALDKIKLYLVSEGFYEAITYSFMSEASLDKLMIPADSKLRNAVQIINPLGADTNLMRTTMVPGMLTVASVNLNRKNDSLKLFEVGKVFYPSETIGVIPDDSRRIVLATTGEGEDFYTLKGYIENMAESLGVKELEFTAGGPDYLHPGRKAMILIDGREFGFIGELGAKAMEGFGIGKRLYIAEIELETLFAACGRSITFKPLPKYPAAERDIAVVVAGNTESGAVRKCILENGGKYIEKADLFDVYAGKQLGDNQKSLAFALSFRAADRTLKEEEINTAMAKILRALETQFDAKLR